MEGARLREAEQEGDLGQAAAIGAQVSEGEGSRLDATWSEVARLDVEYFCVIADRDHVFFEYTPREDSKAVMRIFRGHFGYVQADAKSVFDILFREPDAKPPDDSDLAPALTRRIRRGHRSDAVEHWEPYAGGLRMRVHGGAGERVVVLHGGGGWLGGGAGARAGPRGLAGARALAAWQWARAVDGGAPRRRLARAF